MVVSRLVDQVLKKWHLSLILTGFTFTAAANTGCELFIIAKLKSGSW